MRYERAPIKLKGDAGGIIYYPESKITLKDDIVAGRGLCGSAIVVTVTSQYASIAFTVLPEKADGKEW